ncbi:MAG: C39 family peptidase, partial [Solobacterium sp.]|nr:C39 family peptidase [Solobacterium sp.]
MKKIRTTAVIFLLAILFAVPLIRCSTYPVQEVHAQTETEAGWRKNKKGWWYRNADGSWPAGRWMRIDGKWYHFDEKGYMQTGWLKTGGSWYYLKKGGAMHTGWVKSSGKWYYLSKSGRMQKNRWIKTGGYWYYLKQNGAMHTGWLEYKNDRYYLLGSGRMAVGETEIGGEIYSFDANGALVTDPAENDGELFKVRLQIPQSVQENGHYCGPACLQMALSYKGIEKTQDELAHELNTSMVTGTEYADMARVLNTYLFGCEVPQSGQPGYRVEYLTPSAATDDVMETLKERVIRDIRTEDPVFIAVNLHELYPELPAANHFVIVSGYQMQDGEILYYYIVDPYWKVQSDTYQGL